ncbi:MAG TPA: GNAT family N-acetyltransferase [Gaiellaceae bacterium]|nr:GNAT family N-acetyltransferase [Gaiellaceae bacterium]
MNVRPATKSDYAAIAELFRAVEAELLPRPTDLTADVVDGWLQTLALQTNTWLFEEDGRLVAGAFGQVHGDRGNCAGAVHPSARGRGLGGRLVGLLEDRIREEGAARIHNNALAADTAATELLESRNYAEVRRFWDMAINFDGDIPEPAVAAAPFREEDARAFHATLEEAFAEHWGHEPESFDEWWARQRGRATFDPSAWFVIRDGDEIAAVCRNDPHETRGYVGALGVRPAWRGRGYARALLLHSFREFQRRGLPRATLGVDASNATGATQLYESVGMHVELEMVVWEKILA